MKKMLGLTALVGALTLSPTRADEHLPPPQPELRAQPIQIETHGNYVKVWHNTTPVQSFNWYYRAPGTQLHVRDRNGDGVAEVLQYSDYNHDGIAEIQELPALPVVPRQYVEGSEMQRPVFCKPRGPAKMISGAGQIVGGALDVVGDSVYVGAKVVEGSVRAGARGIGYTAKGLYHLPGHVFGFGAHYHATQSLKAPSYSVQQPFFVPDVTPYYTQD